MGDRVKATVKAFSRSLFAAPLLKGLDKDFVCKNVKARRRGRDIEEVKDDP